MPFDHMTAMMELASACTAEKFAFPEGDFIG